MWAKGLLKNCLAFKFRKCFSSAEWNHSESKCTPLAYWNGYAWKISLLHLTSSPHPFQNLEMKKLWKSTWTEAGEWVVFYSLLPSWSQKHLQILVTVWKCLIIPHRLAFPRQQFLFAIANYESHLTSFILLSLCIIWHLHEAFHVTLFSHLAEYLSHQAAD